MPWIIVVLSKHTFFIAFLRNMDFTISRTNFFQRTQTLQNMQTVEMNVFSVSYAYCE
ncbi:MAG: hypothetical protein IKX40_11475 [Thermoguttaceae bacterium]|nr:hypothetical protein [Thermoguttaceae bacterium]